MSDSPTITKACAFLTDVADLLRSKNAVYGDSAASPLRVFSKASPIDGVLVRIDDKLSRVARGSAAGEDVIKDLVGYLAILWAMLEEQKP